MKKFKFTIISIFLIVVYISIKQYNKPHINVAEITADYKISTNELITDFEKDEIIADKKYANKIIEINGEVTNFSTSNEKNIITLKGDNASVICQLRKQNMEILTTIKLGEFVTIKGQCSGYLMDVMLVNCVIQK